MHLLPLGTVQITTLTLTPSALHSKLPQGTWCIHMYVTHLSRSINIHYAIVLCIYHSQEVMCVHYRHYLAEYGWVSEGWVSEGWMSGWVSGWMSGWVSEWANEWLSKWVRKWLREGVNDRVREWKSEEVTKVGAKRWLSEGVRVRRWSSEWVRIEYLCMFV